MILQTFEKKLIVSGLELASIKGDFLDWCFIRKHRRKTGKIHKKQNFRPCTGLVTYRSIHNIQKPSFTKTLNMDTYTIQIYNNSQIQS